MRETIEAKAEAKEIVERAFERRRGHRASKRTSFTDDVAGLVLATLDTHSFDSEMSPRQHRIAFVSEAIALVQGG